MKYKKVLIAIGFVAGCALAGLGLDYSSFALFGLGVGIIIMTAAIVD